MILDSYFAIACVILLGALIAFVSVAANRDRQLSALLGDLCRQGDEAVIEAKRWREAYEARDAQLAEARTRIDTLEGELTAADIALSQARKNDHRDAKGRFARAA